MKLGRSRAVGAAMTRGEGARLLALLLAAAVFFLLVQLRLFSAQQDYSNRIAADAVEYYEREYASQVRLLLDQLSACQGKQLMLEDETQQLELKNAQLSTLYNGLRQSTGSGSDKKLDLESDVASAVVVREPDVVAAVVVMACNRPDYLDRTLRSILQRHGRLQRASKFPLFISQDGGNPAVKAMAASFSDRFTYMQHMAPEPAVPPGEQPAYYKIADHYKWAMSQLFDDRNFSKVIILEDDMELAPDFFDYFEATAALLDSDSSLIAVSSWNDNGQRDFVRDPESLHRADFFPGLGWMLTKTLWDELAPKWPKAYWDDWLRLAAVRKGRQVIRPEVCRTYNFGEHGSSLGQYFRQYLEPIKLNDVAVDWKSKDLSYLLHDHYQAHFSSLLDKAVTVSDVAQADNIDSDVKIYYASETQFRALASRFGVFQEWKDGVPRTAYKGVVVFRWQTDRRVFLVPSHSPPARRRGLLTTLNL